MSDGMEAVFTVEEADQLPTPSIWRRARALVSEVWGTRFYITFAALVLGYALVVTLTAKLFGQGVTATSNLYSQALHFSILTFFVLYAFYRPLYIMIAVRPKHLTKTILQDFGSGLFNIRRLMAALPIIILLPFFFSMFTSAKNLIPVINPFHLDPMFADIESGLHFGKTPWAWLQPFLGAAIITAAISFIYKTWFFTKFIMCLWQAFARRRSQLREQFFLTFILSWVVVGTILALLLSSAGPCFFGELYPSVSNPYAGLMPYLRHTNEVHIIHDLVSMDYLMHYYTLKETVIFSGISAMPSMHVSLAFLFLLVANRTNAVARVCFAIYLVLILIGSVHLGWHYAIDGYLAILVTWLLWRLSGWWLGADLMKKEKIGNSAGGKSMLNS